MDKGCEGTTTEESNETMVKRELYDEYSLMQQVKQLIQNLAVTH